MLVNLLSGGFSQMDIMRLLVRIPVILFSLSLHEAAHGYVAERMGDPTARYMGRITLNPIKHLDPIGSLAMLIGGFGWAKPVPINPRNFRHPRKGMALTGLAGPVSNLILAFVSMLALSIMSAFLPVNFVFHGAIFGFYEVAKYSIFDVIGMMLYTCTVMNITLAVFNLIPIPPFDGSRIFYAILPDKYYFGVMRYERQTMIVAYILLFAGVLSPIISVVSGIVMFLFDFIIGLVPFL